MSLSPDFDVKQVKPNDQLANEIVPDKIDGVKTINPAIPVLSTQAAQNPLPWFPLEPLKRPGQPGQTFTELFWDKDNYVPAFGNLLPISFLNGNEVQRAKVRKYADRWRRGAATIRYRYVNGIHGVARIAFDDPVVPLNPGWSQSDNPFEKTANHITFASRGLDSYAAFNTPENAHIGNIDSNVAKASDVEKMYIRHAFGHLLGLGFAGEVPSDNWKEAVSRKVARKLGWKKDGVKALFQGSIDPGITPPSVMQYGWLTDIHRNDLIAIAKKYPIRARIVRSSIRDLALRSTSHSEDAAIFVLGWDNRIYRNRRVYAKDPNNNLSNPVVRWSYWYDVFELSLQDAPPNIQDFAILDMSDRLEILVIDEDGVFQFKRQNKSDNTWDKEWMKINAKFPLATKVKILEIEGGYEVVFVTSERKLAHFSRKSGDADLPKEYHPIKSENIDRIVAARVGPPTNPIKIYASTVDDLYSVELDQKTLAWKPDTVGADKLKGIKNEIAFGMAGTTENAFVAIDTIISIFSPTTRQLWHNRNSDGGWFEWRPLLDGVNVKEFAIGEASSADKESRYLQVFVLDVQGQLWYNRVHEEGTWNPSDDVKSEKSEKWVLINPIQTDPQHPEKTYFGNLPLADKVYTKRAKSGDLEVFIISRGDHQIHRLGIDGDGFKLKNFEARVWGEPVPEED